MLSRSSLLALIVVAAIGCDSPRERAPSPAPSTQTTTPVPRRADGPAIEYTLRFEAAHNHYVDVEMTIPTGGAPSVELMMAVWTPGSYLVREYSRHLVGLEATRADDADTDAPTLEVRKTRKNRWTVATGGAPTISVRYRIYGHTATVRTNFFDDELAVIIGAATFLTVAEKLDVAHDVVVIPRSGWSKSVTALPPHPGGAAHHYLATSFDELVDSPIVVGNPTVNTFDVDGVPHALATFAGGDAWDAAKSAADVEKVTRAHIRFWGNTPYSSYTYLNALISSGGRNGLEHKSSTLMTANPWLMTDESQYRGWLGLVSHEFFHTWNVKRLRPIELGPFDYENEVYTRGLWIAEGITSYYDDVLLARAGIYDETRYIDALGGQIKSVQQTPGRTEQSLANASFDAWIEYYRPDENSANTATNYYSKGAVVAFLLDAQIRIATSSRHSLDDVMRLAYQRHSGERGFTSAEFRAVASEVAGIDLASFFRDYVDGTVELDFQPALDLYGLRFKPVEPPKDDARGASLGVRAGGEGRVLVRRVERDTPAYAAGINVGDELIAIDGHRIPTGGLEKALGRLEPETKVEVMVARRGKIRTLEVTLAAEKTNAYKLERAPLRSTRQVGELKNLLAPYEKR